MKTKPRDIVNGLLSPTPYQLYRKRGKEVLRDAFIDQAQLVGQNKAKLIFDVGAHQGLISDRYLNLFPSAIVHAFEPFPPIFEKLTQRAQSQPRLQPHRCALSDQEGQATLHCNTFDPTNSLLATDPEAADHWGDQPLRESDTIQIPTQTLDSFCESNDITCADILKLDVQGAELMALRGARGLLEAGRISLVYTELITVPTYQHQSAYHEVMGYLDSLGYALYNLYNPCYQKGLVLQYDGLFVSPQIRNRLKV